MSRADQEKTSLFSPARYDDDATSVTPNSEQDFESDTGRSVDGKTSMEIAQHDRELLAEEDAREALLSGATGQQERSIKARDERRERKQHRKEARRDYKRKRYGKEGESEMMYEMEEGGHQSESDTSKGSSEPDPQQFHAVYEEQPSRRTRLFKRAGVYLAIIFLFLTLLSAAYRASRASSATQLMNLLSNGTSHFAPTTILISLDGFRADFLNRGLTPTLNSFVQDGVSPLYMLPSFPSLTFPNHYTIVTGLFPESHGIVGNSFWDPTYKEDFSYTRPLSMRPKWWGGEPVWVTAESQGVRTATHMWPGSEAHIGGVEPAYVDKYNGSEILSRKVDRILQLLDMSGPENPQPNSPRPQLIAAYVPVVDTAGHKYGPNSTEIQDTIRSVDDMLRNLFAGLEARNLTDIVNIIVVSDHGMATTSTDRLIQLEDLIDTSLIEHTDGWPLYGLRPKNIDDLESLYLRLHEQAENNPNYDVYLRDKNMPERYHFSDNDRIAPLWIVPRAGWAIVTKDEFDVAEGLRQGLLYHPRGLHGYDHEHPLMRAIFMARGPAFPHEPGSRVEVFRKPTSESKSTCQALTCDRKHRGLQHHMRFNWCGTESEQWNSPFAIKAHWPACRRARAAFREPSRPSSGRSKYCYGDPYWRGLSSGRERECV